MVNESDHTMAETRSSRELIVEGPELISSVIPQDDEDGRGFDSGTVEDQNKDYEMGPYIVDSDARIPKVGMEFETEEEAYDFYNNYAHETGFRIRRSKGHKDRSGQMKDRVFCCSCQGRRETDRRDTDVKCHRPETRCGCLAQMKVNSRFSGKFRVIRFVAEHSHGLAPPNKYTFSRPRRCTASAKTGECGVADKPCSAPKARVKLSVRRVDSHQNISSVAKKCNNYLPSRRTVGMKAGDAGALLEYLQNMQSDPNFYYGIQVDLDDYITNIFWVDARMKSDYLHFGDVVCLDTTYRNNQECRPLVLFIGVNHHKQAVVFGAALLYDETCTTFSWLFDSFVMAMSGKKPQTLLTDQDPAIAKALESQWSETHHRFCVWHIYRSAVKQLNDVFMSFDSFDEDFGSCLYDHDDEEAFIYAWNEMLDKYNLNNNTWLQRQFGQRERWSWAYGRQVFCADMSTTLRSESMVNQMKSYIGHDCDLFQFFHHFQRLLDDMRYEELKADVKAIQRRSLPKQVEIMKHAASVYTPAIFEMFHDEIWLTWDCEWYNIGGVGSVTKYRIVPNGKPIEHVVTFDSVDSTIVCSCMKFECLGILCAHALKVLYSQNFKRVPDRYILKRWTQGAKAESGGSSCESARSQDIMTDIRSRHKNLFALYAQLAARASMTEESYRIAVDSHAYTLNEVETSLKNLSVEDDIIVSSCGKEKDSQSNDSARRDDGNDNVGFGVESRGAARCGTSRRSEGDFESSVKRKKHHSEASSQTQQLTQRTNEKDYGSSLVAFDGLNQLPPSSQFNQQPNFRKFDSNLDIGLSQLLPSQFAETQPPPSGNQEK